MANVARRSARSQRRRSNSQRSIGVGAASPATGRGSASPSQRTDSRTRTCRYGGRHRGCRRPEALRVPPVKHGRV
eukprot:12283139-Alexandrium_andersonii.AAC.1